MWPSGKTDPAPPCDGQARQPTQEKHPHFSKGAQTRAERQRASVSPAQRGTRTKWLETERSLCRGGGTELAPGGASAAALPIRGPRPHPPGQRAPWRQREVAQAWDPEPRSVSPHGRAWGPSPAIPSPAPAPDSPTKKTRTKPASVREEPLLTMLTRKRTNG